MRSLSEPVDGQVLARTNVVYVVNVDWFFLSHRLVLALAARTRGADVTVVAADTGRGDEIRSHGLRFVPVSLSRQGRNPLRELSTLLALARVYRSCAPTLLHHVTVKPVLYGSVAASVTARDAAVVNAISGLGFTFTEPSRARVLARGVRWLYRVALRRGWTIFQNRDDLAAFTSQGLVPLERAVLIRGSGVDCERFHPMPLPDGPPVVLLPARMLWDKGIGEFVEAAAIVRRSRPNVRFVLAGDTDPGNPTAVPRARLDAWQESGVVEWWGHQERMDEVLRAASLVVLPTYREGLPKALLEAAACARAMVATDVPGCREVVHPCVNGLLVPPRNAHALAAAVLELLEDPDRMKRYGAAGRALVESELSEGAVVEQTMALYETILGRRSRSGG